MDKSDGRFVDRLTTFLRDIEGIEHCAEPGKLQIRSRDRYNVSPLLAQALKGKAADVAVAPRTLDDVLRVVKAAARLRMPLTVKGGGTANYGQSVPLHGGVLLEMRGFDGIVALTRETIRARGGTTFAQADTAAGAIGRELRFYPSTRRTATLAGHLAGGQGGPGSVAYGVLSDAGNVAAAQIVTMEERPRILELKGDDAQRVYHTYGATGIITEIELPLAPAYAWREALLAFSDFAQAVRFGVALAGDAAITKKIVSILEWPIAELITQFARFVPGEHASVSTMIAEADWPGFARMVADAGGQIVASAPEGTGPYGAPITEFTFGHALYQIQKVAPNRAGIEGFFRGADLAACILGVQAAVRRFGPMRIELIRIEGELVGTGSPIFDYGDAAQMSEIVAAMQAAGASVANSHASNVRTVGKKRVSDVDVAFKRDVDPHGLLNPGRFEIDRLDDDLVAASLPTDSWRRIRA